MVKYLYGIKLIESDFGLYLYDAHSSVTGILDSNCDISQSYTYDPFGADILSAAESEIRDPEEMQSLIPSAGIQSSGIQIGYIPENPYRYCGEYTDIETGYVYLRARYYDPTIGRFISEDSAKDGYNWYVYCGNDPINRVDPSGEFWSRLLAATLTIAVAAVFVVAIVASAGAVGVAAGVALASIGATGTIVSAAITAGTVGTYAVAAGIGVCALSNAGEILTGTNLVRDQLMNGNQDAYDTLQGVLAFVGCSAIIVGQTNPGVSGNYAISNQDAKEIHKVPVHGTPNTNIDKIYNGGNGAFQRTYYDFRGNISLQIDFTNHNNPQAHSNPHLHTYWFGERQPQKNLWYLEW